MKRGVPLWQNVADYAGWPGLVDLAPSFFTPFQSLPS